MTRTETRAVAQLESDASLRNGSDNDPDIYVNYKISDVDKNVCEILNINSFFKRR